MKQVCGTRHDFFIRDYYLGQSMPGQEESSESIRSRNMLGIPWPFNG